MNPVIFHFTQPRSMSTAIERVMRERGDFESYHEYHLPLYPKLRQHSLTSLAHGH